MGPRRPMAVVVVAVGIDMQWIVVVMVVMFMAMIVRVAMTVVVGMFVVVVVPFVAGSMMVMFALAVTVLVVEHFAVGADMGVPPLLPLDVNLAFAATAGRTHITSNR